MLAHFTKLAVCGLASASLWASAALAQGGSASDTPVSSSTAQVTYIVRTEQKTFEFQNWLKTGLMGGGAGAAAAAIAAATPNQTLQDEALDDPANGLSAELAKRFATQIGADVGKPVTLDATHPKLSNGDTSARYVVEVRTDIWDAMYLGFDFGHYGVRYSAVLTIRDPASGKNALRALCFVPQIKDQPEPPNKEELMADDGAIVKRQTTKAAQECLAQLEKKLIRVKA